ncbi:unnamed protein product [Lactuca virosa]|uniref:Uncharacterized protein n=1 Tax=Lactuca virosa TaxID=75947 RepID=A0AAU9MGF0_9ASTR|nr:unnamed protein product [Lactuca virosa]
MRLELGLESAFLNILTRDGIRVGIESHDEIGIELGYVDVSDLMEVPILMSNETGYDEINVFKLRKNGSLAGPNPKLRPTPPSPPQPSLSGEKITPPYVAKISTIGRALGLMLLILGFIIFRRVKRSGDKSSDEQKSKDSGLPSDRCHRFTIYQRI